MAHNPRGSQHCSHEGCHQLEFLPFRCDHCEELFCVTHSGPNQHSCPNWAPDLKNTHPPCPICQKFVYVAKHQDVDTAVNQHLMSGCTQGLLEQHQEALQRAKAHTKTCGLSSCDNKENFDTTLCRDCNIKFCLSHRFPTDHSCSSLQPKKSQFSLLCLIPLANLDVKHVDSFPLRCSEKSGGSFASRILSKFGSSSSDGSSRGPSRITKLMRSNSALERQKRLKVRQRAKGNAKILAENRFALEICVPEKTDEGFALKQPPRSLWFNKKWTVGRTVDDICKRTRGLDNHNNDAKRKSKLALFVKGAEMPLPNDAVLHLLRPELLPGDTVELRYWEPPRPAPQAQPEEKLSEQFTQAVLVQE